MNPKILAIIVVFVLLAGVIGTPIMQSVHAATYNEATEKKTMADKKAADAKKAVENKTIKPILTPKQTGDFTQALNGKYHGTAKWDASFEYYDKDRGSYHEVCQYSGSITVQLVRDGNHVIGNVDLTDYQLTGAVERSVCDNEAFGFDGSVDVTIFGSGFSGKVGLLDVDGQFTSDLLRGRVSGDYGDVAITGEFTTNRVN